MEVTEHATRKAVCDRYSCRSAGTDMNILNGMVDFPGRSLLQVEFPRESITRNRIMRTRQEHIRREITFFCCCFRVVSRTERVHLSVLMRPREIWLSVLQQRKHFPVEINLKFGV